MFNGKKILAIIPARGGSKGLRLKNLRKVNKVPLVAYVAKIVNKIPLIDRAVVSTDHKKIAKIAKKAGLSVPFKRPFKISGDKISDYDVIVHALNFMEKKDKTKYDIIVSLPPTSPLRKPADVIGAIKMLINKNFDSVWTVSKTDNKYHPLKQLKIIKNKIQFYSPKGSKIIARQQLKPVYHRNGVAYVMTRKCLKKKKNIITNNTGAYLVDNFQISVDTRFDLKLVNYFLS